jgi:hypothetical protein
VAGRFALLLLLPSLSLATPAPSGDGPAPRPTPPPAGQAAPPLRLPDGIAPKVELPPRIGQPPALRIIRLTLTRPQAKSGDEAGAVTLEAAPRDQRDPDGSFRLEAVQHGPVASAGGGDLYALNAELIYPPDRLLFVPGSIRKGDLLGRDGRDVLVTARVNPGKEGHLFIGSSRLGMVPGVAAPAGLSRLFSVAFQVLKPGDASLSWKDATFINHEVRPIEGSRFLGGLLHVEADDPKSTHTGEGQ